MKKSVLGASAGAVALVATLTLAGGTAAQAATVKAPHRVIPAASCWADASTGQSLCVRKGVDLIDAVRAATGKTILVPVGVKIGGVRMTESRARSTLLFTSAAATQTLISAVYDDINYGGGTYALTAPGSGCDWGFSNMVNIGWNDRVSSFKSFNGCTTALFKDINYGGTRIGYSSSKSSLGSMNDQASSWATQ